jgi:hypothetical protein
VSGSNPIPSKCGYLRARVWRERVIYSFEPEKGSPRLALLVPSRSPVPLLFWRDRWSNMLCLASLLAGSMREETDEGMVRIGVDGFFNETTHAHGPLYSSSIRPSQHDSLLYTQFSRTHLSSVSSSIHYETHLSLYLNISMCDLVLKDLLRRI